MNEHFRREKRWSHIELPDSLVSIEPGPDRIVEGREAVRTLAEALRRMPGLRREVIVRRRVNHQSCAAIAEELGLSVKAVEKHVTRALLDLNDAFKDKGPGRGRVQ